MKLQSDFNNYLRVEYLITMNNLITIHGKYDKTNNNKYPNSKSSLQQSPNQGKSKKVTKAKGWTSLL